MFNNADLNQMYRYALALCADPDEAFDLLQDGLERYLRAGPHIAAKERLYYLRRVLRNRYIDTTRKLSRQLEVAAEVQNTLALDTRALDDMLYTEQALEKVWPLLTAAERELLFLWAVEGFTAQEIADQLDTPRGTVLSRLHRLRGRLRSQFPELDGEEAQL